MKFEIHSKFKPTGDQPKAIKELVAGLNEGSKHQTLLGVTGSGKTFTVANVIKEVGRPTLVMSHNKTLAAQLYSEFKHFFPDNLVEYFVSYYDYYQPEAFLPTTNTYIEKDLQINAEIEKLRLSATSALLSGRKDIIVIASVSCIYGIGNPAEFHKNVITVKTGDVISRNKFLIRLVEILYSRTQAEFNRGTFRVNGDTIDIFLAYADHALRVSFWGDEIETIETIQPESGDVIMAFDEMKIYPANLFVTAKDALNDAIWEIQQDMKKQVDYYNDIGRRLEAKRLEDRVTYDLEMMRELGYCSGIENYSRYFDRRKPGERPFCLIDYFPDDFLMVIDESHVTVPQVKAMYGGDRSRKINLVEYGFRLPSAVDNRPLKFEEWENMHNQTIYISATPADYELEKSEGVIVEQVIRPTGLLDPLIDVRPSLNQIDDLMNEIQDTITNNERTLVTTLTKRMAEELDKYLRRMDIKCRYIHSDVDTLERVEILSQLREGVFDVLIGVNLLREGLDLPEVSLVAILDADKEGFLRNHRSLTQTSGRAARNVNGRVIFYADKMTGSMQSTIDETLRRREKQMKYNTENGITPTQIIKNQDKSVLSPKSYGIDANASLAADPVIAYMSEDQLKRAIKQAKRKMDKAAKEMDFIAAAQFRDEWKVLKDRKK